MELTERSRLILNILLENKTIDFDEITNTLGVSQRTIRNALSEIDSYLMMQGMGGLNKQTKTTYSLPHDVHKLVQLVKQEKTSRSQNIDYWEEPLFRQGYFYEKIFWQYKRITIGFLEESLCVSRSTINTDIRNIKADLKKKNIELMFDKSSGFYLDGNENDLRDMYFYYCNVLGQYNYELEAISHSYEILFNAFIDEIEEALYIEFTYNSRKHLQTILSVWIRRIKMKKFVLKNRIKNLYINEIQDIEKICKKLNCLQDIDIPKHEYGYLLEKIRQRSLMKNDCVDQGYRIDINILVNQFLQKASELLNIRLLQDRELYRRLALHIQTSFSKRGEQLNDIFSKEMCTNIQKMHPDIYKVVKQSIQQIEDIHDSILNNSEEFAFLTLHLALAVEKIKEDMRERIQVALVCHMGVGTSQFLKFRLNQYFKFHLEVVTKNDLSMLENKPDMVLSTIPMDINLSTKIPCIQVTPYLTVEDIQSIRLQESEIVKNRVYSASRSKEEGIKEPMLKELLTEEVIRTGVEVNDWEDAIRQGGKLLEDNGSIEPRYTEAMIEGVKKFGPYIVIIPHIALAHASSVDGVNKIGISLMILKNSIDFGNKKNDPVHIVVSLAAIDHHTHLKALQELSKLLSNSEFIEFISTANAKEIADYIQKNKEKSEM